MARTREELTRSARRLTAQRGLAGFTVEELCDEVGISRRTFFNYFHSKDDAIVGRSEDGFSAAAEEAFVASERRGRGTVGPALLADLLELFTTEIERVGVSPAEVGAFIAAVAKEPQLLTRMMQSGGDRLRYVIELVERREGLAAGDPAAKAAVLVAGSLLQSASERFFAPENTTPFRDLIAELLTGARAVFAADARS
jgi:AcrR family transcriptional regulator